MKVLKWIRRRGHYEKCKNHGGTVKDGVVILVINIKLAPSIPRKRNAAGLSKMN